MICEDSQGCVGIEAGLPRTYPRQRERAITLNRRGFSPRKAVRRLNCATMALGFSRVRLLGARQLQVLIEASRVSRVVSSISTSVNEAGQGAPAPGKPAKKGIKIIRKSLR
jgi:hypothetical protein